MTKLEEQIDIELMYMAGVLGANGMPVKQIQYHIKQQKKHLFDLIHKEKQAVLDAVEENFVENSYEHNEWVIDKEDWKKFKALSLLRSDLKKGME